MTRRRDELLAFAGDLALFGDDAFDAALMGCASRAGERVAAYSEPALRAVIRSLPGDPAGLFARFSALSCARDWLLVVSGARAWDLMRRRRVVMWAGLDTAVAGAACRAGEIDGVAYSVPAALGVLAGSMDDSDGRPWSTIAGEKLAEIRDYIPGPRSPWWIECPPEWGYNSL